MTDMLIHRGTDGEGFYINPDKNVGLGHRRLSIIDLLHNADQPMSFDDLTLIFNGEIYNYLEIKEELIRLGYFFKTKSDTEVLLKAYYHYYESVFVWDEKMKEYVNNAYRKLLGEKIIDNNPVNSFNAWEMINLAKLWE